jgi:hypothetical protein
VVPKGPQDRRRSDPAIYQLTETPASAYLQRTEWNVRDSDATLIFTLDDNPDGGSKRTLEFAGKLGKPCLHIRPGVHPKFIAWFLQRHGAMRLNVAGKRESSAPGMGAFVEASLSAALAVEVA